MRTRSTALLAALLLPTFAIAQDAGESAPPCSHPVQVLWHADATEKGEDGKVAPVEGLHRMGVSVTNQSGQQVPNLTADVFEIFHKGTKVEKNDAFKVSQSKNVLVQAAAAEDEEDVAAATALASDPINYDVYFAIDLTKTMGDEIDGKSKKQVVAEVIRKMTVPEKEGQDTLFDKNDRVYIAGFTEKVVQITEAPTVKREKLIPALGSLAQYEVEGDFAAFYGAVHHNLSLITQAADQYKDPAKKRQAVLIAITDSFNGINPSNGRRVKYCNNNNELNDTLRQGIIDTRAAVGEQFKMYVLGIGAVGEGKRYRLKEDHHRYCRIDYVQKDHLDAKSLVAIASPKITNGGGLNISQKPDELGGWLTAKFEALKTAYEITYSIPKEAADASLYRASVTILEKVCSGELIEANQFIRQATKKTDTTPAEVALFLGSLLLALLFLPRTLVNLGNLGGGEKKKPAPKKKNNGSGKNKKRKK